MNGQIVRLASTIGGVSVAIVALVGVFARESIWVVAPVVGALALMGIVLGYFAREKK